MTDIQDLLSKISLMRESLNLADEKEAEYMYNELTVHNYNDFSINIPKGFIIKHNRSNGIEVKELIAYEKNEFKQLIKSFLNIQISRKKIIPLSKEDFYSKAEIYSESKNVELLKEAINGLPAVINVMNVLNTKIILGSILNDDYLLNVRVTFTKKFTNSKELAFKIIRSFKINTSMNKKDYIKERVLKVANYIISSQSTIRKTAEVFGISKSTIHKDMTERLPKINPLLAMNVKRILDNNKKTSTK